LWSDHANATPLSDLVVWAQQYSAATGEMPGSIIMSRTARSHMLQSAEVKSAARPGVTNPSVIAPAELNAVLEAFELPAITVYETRVDVGGTDTRVLASEKVVFGPSDPASLGETVWGITAEALELAGLDN